MGRDISQSALEKFLTFLDPDRDRAGERYLQLREQMAAAFERKGSRDPEGHTDEVINRACRRIEEGEVIENIFAYCYGILRYVWLESVKKPRQELVPIDDYERTLQIEVPDTKEEEARMKCLETCLDRLPSEKRDLIINYYKEERGEKIECRKRLAEERGISAHALQVLASRLRKGLKNCVSGCLKSIKAGL